ncbi:MAG TPA: DUF3768 domain-containing protein [Ktedonobacteraceae bacterium]|nr:DUF3768 domain-containing protein [Ktedonobacteraceae bacterium]
MDAEAAAKVAKLNDEFRRSGQGVVVTRGVQALPQMHGLLLAVREYTNFSEENDPYGEHDFGSFSWSGEDLFWKIDYYDQKLEWGEDPLSPKCRRVMTILLASEY